MKQVFQKNVKPGMSWFIYLQPKIMQALQNLQFNKRVKLRSIQMKKIIRDEFN